MSVKMKETLISKRVLKCMYMGFLLSNDDNKYSESDILSLNMDDMLSFLNKFNTNIHMKNKYNIIEFKRNGDLTFFTVYGDLLMVVSDGHFVKDFINLVLENYRKIYPNDNTLPKEIDIFDLNSLDNLPLYDIDNNNNFIYEGYFRKHYKVNKLNLFKII